MPTLSTEPSSSTEYPLSRGPLALDPVERLLWLTLTTQKKLVQARLPIRRHRLPGAIVVSEKKTLLRSGGNVGFHLEFVE